MSESGSFRFSDVVKVSTGLSPAQSPQVSQTDGYVDFGSAYWLNLPKPTTVWLTNTTQAPLRFGTAKIVGTNAANFTLARNGCGTSAWPTGASCAMTVNYAGKRLPKTARL